MRLNDYQALAMRTDTLMSDELENITCAAMGLGGESGELIDYVKKVRYQGHPLDKMRLIDEAGDNLWYIAKLARALGVDLQYIAEYNIEKLRKRYPEGFSAERSQNREEA